MLNDPAVGGLRIDVDTFKGVVTLSGRVKSQAEREQAIALARAINGVVEVKDALQVIPENHKSNFKVQTRSPIGTFDLCPFDLILSPPALGSDLGLRDAERVERARPTPSRATAGPQTKQSVASGSCRTASKCDRSDAAPRGRSMPCSRRA